MPRVVRAALGGGDGGGYGGLAVIMMFVQTKLCHTLALAAAEAETGLSRPSIDRAFIPVLLELMSDPGSRRGPDVPLQACRALNYFLQVRLW